MTSEIIHPVGTSHYIRSLSYTNDFDYTPTEDCIVTMIVVYKGDSSIFQGILVIVKGSNTSNRLVSFYEKTATAKDVSLTFPVVKGVTYHFRANGTFPDSVKLNEWN